LKSEWPTDIAEVARQIAGHANAARGAPILWLIGVHQRKGAVGALHEELSAWWPQVRAQFDEQLAPAIQDVNVPVHGKTVVALLFETDYAPFVVKNPSYNTPGGGRTQRDVPWRTATGTWSATRADLIRLLVPKQRLPDVEVLSASLGYRIDKPGGSDDLFNRWRLYMTLYMVPNSREQICIPFHKCSASFELPGVDRVLCTSFALNPPYDYDTAPMNFSPRNKSLTIVGTDREVLINGPGSLQLRAEHDSLSDERLQLQLARAVALQESVQVSVKLQPTHTDLSVPINITLRWETFETSMQETHWKY
jgi:hypothetical protein